MFVINEDEEAKKDASKSAANDSGMEADSPMAPSRSSTPTKMGPSPSATSTPKSAAAAAPKPVASAAVRSLLKYYTKVARDMVTCNQCQKVRKFTYTGFMPLFVLVKGPSN